MNIVMRVLSMCMCSDTDVFDVLYFNHHLYGKKLSIDAQVITEKINIKMHSHNLCL